MTESNLSDEQLALDKLETQDWLESLDELIARRGKERARDMIQDVQIRAQKRGVKLPATSVTPYTNTISVDHQPVFPGDREIERRIKSILRWNAMAMVVRANRQDASVGGHISTYASAATLYEVGFNHFFRGRSDNHLGDFIYFQGHASPGIYARAFLEGRLSPKNLENFRRELAPGGGLSSYPHPWLMPDFWQFPTVSMGLGPIMAIYQARFIRYLEDRGLIPESDSKVIAFLGDGETDEPESLGAISLATREKLDNLIFVINCNLQRLDGPVRGNGQIIQELEANFRGNGWNVIKVIWGSDWDELLAKDKDGILVRRMGEIVDGEFQKYSTEDGDYIRKHFFGKYPETLKMVEHLSDEQLTHMRMGGHDPEKVYAAFRAAYNNKSGAPTVILARTIKGYGLGESGEGKNITHQQKKLNEDELRIFRRRFDIPISEDDIGNAPFYRPAKDSIEMKYLLERRRALGGFLPRRIESAPKIELPDATIFDEFYKGTEDREVSTTMAFVRMLTKMLKDKEIGKLIVPIVPDEARTFGMEALFRQCGIYAHTGQLYEPVDRESLLYYKEATDGQILEEGITEAGSLCSFIAAGTAYANYGVNMIPFFIYYSMFGFQRVGDLIWAAGDLRCRGFLLGGTAGRTTLAGEGLQHQDGHSHLLAYPVPNLMTYDPAYAFELAIIIQEGIKRMYQDQEAIFYYLTVGNENYTMPAMPDNCRDGILKGLYKLLPAQNEKGKLKAQLIGSGAILNEVVKARDILFEKYGVVSDVWSATSYKELRRDGMECDRFNLFNPEKTPKVPYVTQMLGPTEGVIVAASDYVKVMSDMIGRWIPRPLISLGTEGYGRSENRKSLRDFFEVDARYVVLATLHGLVRDGQVKPSVVSQAIKDMDINPDKLNPLIA
ncbi:MAG TPA: pyruvate dehydrogenase (acetyl-transferring), homodimeric type [Kiritimatiellia bacterium]|nr:pyruvate dehydrogenase (acetyl-transferring), homodimeric type [Kiritimatiellia bacterium]